MNLDVSRAREKLSHTLQAALAAAREHGAALAAVNIEETSAWEAAGERLVPRLDAAVLRDAALLVGEPRLPELLAGCTAAVAEAESRRDDLMDAILDPPELATTADRRAVIDERLGDLRSRLKELRSRPGMLQLLDAAAKGQRLKEEQQRAIRLHDELQSAIASLEAEGTRLAAVTARHHRAKRDLHSVDDEATAIRDRFLTAARRLVVDRLMQPSGPHHGHPEVVRACDAAIVGRSKRTVLSMLYESWVRPHGSTLLEFEQRHAGTVSGFETVSYPASVDILCREAAVSVDAYRTAASRIVGFSSPEPVTDWWSALVPGVPCPADSVFESLGLAPLPPPPVKVIEGWHASDAASDKLAAAWASIKQDPPSEDDSGFLSEATEGAFMSDLHAGETEVLMALPKAPPLNQNTNASNVHLSSDEYQSIFDDVHGAGSDAEVFTAAQGNPFEQRRVEAPPSRPGVDFGDIAKPTFAVGSRVGRCIVKGLVGKGGMGEVYRARLEGEHGFSRSVVLKRLALERDGDQSVLTSFVREAEIAARIAHPNVVQIFDLQSHGGEPFIMMEFLEGLPLQKLATRAHRGGLHIPPDILARCALDSARGLHAAHSMRSDDGALVGLVHRDVSPDNLFLCQNGFTKLLDFGIARRSDLTTMTGKNELKGKIPFMSPEQILGDPLDARSDLFSLGSSLYWLLTGERAFVGDNEMTTLYAVVNKPYRPMDETRPDAVPLIGIIDALLEKSRDDRPSSALEVVSLLNRVAVASNEEAAAFLQRVEEL
jgi:hypothetical protein